MSLPHVRTIAFLALLVLIVGYAGLEARALVEGPSISLTSPIDGASASAAPIEVSGTATRIESISLNGRPIFVDADGNFSEQLLLPPGYTILSVRAEDRFGRMTEKQIHLFRNS
jgi:hypothetical protein